VGFKFMMPDIRNSWVACKSIGVITACVLLMSGVHAADFNPLGSLQDGFLASWALDVSDDGSVVVGDRINEADRKHAFRWTSDTGVVGLGNFPDDFYSNDATGVSADGSVVVGIVSYEFQGDSEAYRWTSANDMVGLGDLPGGAIDSNATGVSADGNVIVGRGTSALGNEAYRWTSDLGMVGLGDLEGGRFMSGANR